MKIVITGGLGFIGHNVALYLKRLGFQIVCVDNLSSNYNSMAVDRIKSEGIEMIFKDICKTQDMIWLLRNSDIIIHCAAYTSVVESISNPVKYFNNNVSGTASVAKACGDADVARIIYLSSAAVYGEPKYLPVDENHPTQPLSPYGLTKLMAEKIIEYYSNKYGFEYVNLRLFNVYGPSQVENEYSGVITKFIKRIRAGSPPVIYGDGEQTRDFIHVRDVCVAVERAVSTSNFNQTYNIGSGKPVKIRDLANLMISLSGLKIQPVHEPSREGEIKHGYADISRAERLLGFKPTVNIDDGVKELLGLE
ncbi:MAG: NAD-dependent epimerase/dehydratase family protein [Thermoproteota archaeon]